MSLETPATRLAAPAPPHLPTPQSSLLAFACNIVLPDLLLLTRILEKSVAVGTTFGLYFDNDELCIQTIMAQDQLGFDACMSQTAFLPGTSSPAVYRMFTTKQRRAAVLGFLRDHMSTGAIGHGVTQPQPVMISWLDHTGRIAIHVHPADCPHHVHGQPIEDWSTHLIKTCQVIPEGHRISPYVAHFEPISDRYERIVSTHSIERVRAMPVALRFASNQELSNQARDAAMLTVGPLILQWKPEVLTFFGIGASGAKVSDVNCFLHPTAKEPLDFISCREATTGPVSALPTLTGLPTPGASASVVAAAAAYGTPAVQSTISRNDDGFPAGGGGGAVSNAEACVKSQARLAADSSGVDASVEDDEPQVEYAACSLKVAKAHAMVSPTLLHIAGKVLSTQANEPTAPAFLWLPADATKQVIFGGTMSGAPFVRWFVHIQPCQANSLEFCPDIVWRDRPDLKADLACLLPKSSSTSSSSSSSFPSQL